MQKSRKIDNDERTAKICESTETSKIEYGKNNKCAAFLTNGIKNKYWSSYSLVCPQPTKLW